MPHGKPRFILCLVLLTALLCACTEQKAPKKPKAKSNEPEKTTPPSTDDAQPADTKVEAAKPAPSAAAQPVNSEKQLAASKGKIDHRLKGRSRIHASAEQLAGAQKDYFDRATNEVPHRVLRQARIEDLKAAIKQFRQRSGHYPKDLNELERYRGAKMPALPDGYAYRYNDTTGKIGVVKQENK